MEAELEHFAHALFFYEYGDFESFNIILYSLNSEESLALKRAWKTIKKMDGIYGKIFDYYFKNLNNDHFLYSKKDFAAFVLVRSLDICRSPSFYNFLLVVLFMCRLLQSQPRCLLLVQVMAKCLMIVYSRRYEDFFMANGGLIGMRKYFDEIKKEDLRSFISRHANSENEGILIPAFEDVFEIVAEFAKYNVVNFYMEDSELQYLYDSCYPFIDMQVVNGNLKFPKTSVALNIEDENSKIEYVLDKLNIHSEQAVNRVQTKCSYCGEKCCKYIMFQVLYRLHAMPGESIN
ncbi:hypothetical protein CEXT_739001 [Caerostris extrusa]|uniref:Uncharacterized protein n=1 Tax=Caerostris extrusa TaxID=172846 RepID=A0AAV4WCU8_CAEEX|nr:hypothetical protein CEXT_739001 [Caerostris extrusa]